MTKRLRRIGVILGFIVAVAFVTAVGLALCVEMQWARPVRRAVVAMTAPRDAQHLNRGRFLYESSMLCWDCHGSQGSVSPSEPQAGGRDFDMRKVGPGFGFVYGSNLTPDPETGVGDWSDGELVRAIREGLDREGHVIFPVMAYQFYHGLSDEDALSVVTYLRSLPPVRHRVPEARLSFVARALLAFGIVSAEPAITAPIPSVPKGRTLAYGKYVAWYASGCAECHTPRDARTAKLDLTRVMGGGLFPFPEPLFTTTGSNLTLDGATGLGGWTREQFFAAVQRGVRPNGTVLLPFMPWPPYARWDREDLEAVWEYLRSLRTVSHAVPASAVVMPAPGAAEPARGDAIYSAYCLVCHGVKGAGAPFTSLSLRAVARDLDDETLAAMIGDGVPGTAMPPFGKTLAKAGIRELVAAVRAW